jgi:hypothetical protein
MESEAVAEQKGLVRATFVLNVLANFIAGSRQESSARSSPACPLLNSPLRREGLERGT